MDEIYAAAAEAAEFMKTRPYVRGQIRELWRLIQQATTFRDNRTFIDAYYRDIDLALHALTIMTTRLPKVYTIETEWREIPTADS